MRNVPISKLLETLNKMGQYVTHCDIEIDEKSNSVFFKPVYHNNINPTKAIEDKVPEQQEQEEQEEEPAKRKSDLNGSTNFNELIP